VSTAQATGVLLFFGPPTGALAAGGNAMANVMQRKDRTAGARLTSVQRGPCVGFCVRTSPRGRVSQGNGSHTFVLQADRISMGRAVRR